MTLHLATQTINAIDKALQEDQGAKYRQFLGKVLPHIGDAYRPETELFRSHMGASGIAKECPRAIWYSFRWYTPSNHMGRMVRLFNRGHLEEGRMIALLLTIGCQIFQQDANGKQYTISGHEGHYGGSGDGVVIGLPELPAGEPALLEFKTHGNTSFQKLKKEGMRDSKLDHYVQMQTYMYKMKLSYGLYLAVNKNDDELYGEIVVLDPKVGETYETRAGNIIWMKTPPQKISKSPGSFGCVYCDHKPICHLGAPVKPNCRNCAHSYPAAGKQWGCTMHNIGLTKETQLVGCAQHTPIKDDPNAAPAA